MMREYDLRLKSRVVAPNENYGMVLRAWLEIKLPPYAKCYLDTAFAGDAAEVQALTLNTTERVSS